MFAAEYAAIKTTGAGAGGKVGNCESILQTLTFLNCGNKPPPPPPSDLGDFWGKQKKNSCSL